MKKTIKIHNETKLPTISWERLKKEFEPNKLKEEENRDISKLKKAILVKGFMFPICIWEKGKYIIDGAGRFLALSMLEYEGYKIPDIPYHLIKAKNKAEAKEATLMISSSHGKETDQSVSNFVLDMPDVDFSMINLDIDTDEINLDFEQSEEDVIEDEVPEVQKKAKSKLGDVYILGSHRLMCGDSTSNKDVDILMDGNKTDLLFTDPPYGMKKENEGVLNDNLNYDDLLDFNKEWIPITISHLKDSGSWYCWGIDEPLMDIYVHIIKPYIKGGKMTFRNLITWDKGSGQGQNSDLTKSYARADEKCLFIAMGKFGTVINGEDYRGEWDKIINYLQSEELKSGISKEEIKLLVGKHMYGHYFTKSQFTLMSENNYLKLREKTGYFKKNYSEIKKMYNDAKKKHRINQFYFNNTHDNMNNVWHFERTSQKEREGTGEHATPKPLILCQRAIRSSSRDGDNVMDLFGGSGSTLIACEQLNRSCNMMELDPLYVDVIIKRWESFTNKKAVKV